MIAKCKKCGFEAAACFIVAGKCCACSLPVGSDMWNQTPARKPPPVQIIACACGCGTMFNKYDDRAGARRYCAKSHMHKNAAGEAARKAKIAETQRRRFSTSDERSS